METVKVVENYLRLNDPIHTTNSIKFCRFTDYFPQESSHLNRPVPITIRVDNLDNFFLLEQSYFIIEIDLVKKSNGARYANTDLITIANNGPLFLFNKANLKFGDTVIEDYTDVGHATLVQGLLKYNDGFSSNRGHVQCWSLDDDEYTATTEKNPGFANRHALLFESNDNEKGKAKFIIPFSHVFGFRGKILSGIRVSVQLERIINENPIFKSRAQNGTPLVDNVVDGTINITSLTWRIPYFDLNAEMASQISELLVSQPKIPFKFIVKQVEEFPVIQANKFSRNLTTVTGSDKILGFVVVFQTGRLNNQKSNISMFDHCNVKDAAISLNNIRYPGINLYGGTQGLAYMENYNRYLEFRKLFTNLEPEFSPMGYHTAFPIYCFDTSFQEDRISGNTITINIRFQFSENVPANTTAYVITFRERLMSITTAGSRRMKVEYMNSF